MWTPLLALASLLAVGASAADTAAAPAPAPATPAAQKADLLFTLTANTANFTSPTRLTLGNLPHTVQFSGQGKTGTYPTGLFLNSSKGAPFASSNGHWLGNPQAVMYASNHGGNTTAVFLSLSNPSYDSKTNSASFDVATTKEAKYAGGAVANALKDYKNHIGPLVDEDIDATSEYESAALFIDSNRLALGKTSETKWYGWRGGWGRGWGGGWGRGWGGGWGGGWGYQPYYYQPYYGYGCGCNGK